VIALFEAEMDPVKETRYTAHEVGVAVTHRTCVRKVSYSMLLAVALSVYVYAKNMFLLPLRVVHIFKRKFDTHFDVKKAGISKSVVGYFCFDPTGNRKRI